MASLRQGEFLLEHCAGGHCTVCHQKIPPGLAVQLSKYSSRIRHVHCLPKTDTRCQKGPIRHVGRIS